MAKTCVAFFARRFCPVFWLVLVAQVGGKKVLWLLVTLHVVVCWRAPFIFRKKTVSSDSP
jgi:hypothetical protein